jgi:hypothetical protein
LHTNIPATSSTNKTFRAVVSDVTYRSLLRGLGIFAAFAIMVGFAGSATAQGMYTESVPANLAPPDGSVLLFELQAGGVQIYTCAAKPDDATAFVWTFKAPEAELINSQGIVAGHHFGGPTWEGFDGSSVVGNVLERADSPDAGSIPWLLLEAKDHAGTGVFSTITYVQRLDTVGGVAPADGCDSSHADDEVRQPYQATYAFYYASTPSDNATPAS